jgi:hypothetical protein
LAGISREEAINRREDGISFQCPSLFLARLEGIGA